MAMVSIDHMEGLKRLYDLDTGERKALFLASSDGKDKANVMPFSSWAISYVDPRGWCIAVYVFTGHFTHELISKTKQFTVNVPRDEMDEIIECCDSRSGRNHDKFKECGLTAVASCYVAPPIIKECIAHFECEVYNSYPFTMTFPGMDRDPREMTVFEGRIVAAHADEEYGAQESGAATSASQ